MSRVRLVVAGLLVGAFLGFGGWMAAGRDPEPPASTSARTPSGALAFTVPSGGRTFACGSDEGDCLRAVLDGMDDAEAATVSFLPPNPVEGTPVDALLDPDVGVPGSTRITVDGLPAVRLNPDSAGQDTILVAGRARVEAGHAFMVVCPVGTDAERSQGLCDQIVRTLKVTR